MLSFRRLALHSGLLLAALTAFTSTSSATEMASVNIGVGQVSPTVYDYTLTLNNTGTTTIGTLWFSWIPGAGFLSATPSLVNSPAGWTEKLTSGNAAIQWTTSTNLLASGSSLTGFEFFSTETPAQLDSLFTTSKGVTEPATVAFIYAGAPMSDPGFQLTASVAPEPPASLLTLTGLLGIVAVLNRKRLGLQ